MVDKNKKVKKIKEEKFKSEEQQEIIRFVKILLIVLLFVVLVYFLTRIFVKQDMTDNKEETPVIEVDYSKMVFGTMLNRPYEEYYVFAFSSKDNKANYYYTLGNKYAALEDSEYLYYIDLEEDMNKAFIAVDGKSNPKATSLENLKVGEVTLIKIENGKIVKYIEELDDIKSELKK